MADDETLREMARHRGFRLVKSRRRKAGGDYGRYGLTDAAGKQCFGFSKTGLTATPEQIESYLRSVESASWRRSLGAAPAKAAKTAKARAASPSPEPPKPAVTKIATRPRRQPATQTRRSRPAPPVKRKPPPPAEPPPVLTIREAAAGDVAVIERLLRALRGTAGGGSGRSRLDALIAMGEPPLLAERGRVIGCVGWHVMPTLQHGKIGRISLIFVAEGERGQGIGRALLAAAEARLRKAGCTLIEAVSDIAVINAHGFFRSLGYQQASYRFTRPAKSR